MVCRCSHAETGDFLTDVLWFADVHMLKGTGDFLTDVLWFADVHMLKQTGDFLTDV